MKKRATFADVSDPMGPWFDGVEYLKQKNPNATFVAATKEKKFGILGGGISGLLTAVSQNSYFDGDIEMQSATPIRAEVS